MVDDGLCDLPKAWAMISTNAAHIMGLSDRGTLVQGKRADVAIVNAQTHAVEGTICAGRITHLTGEAAHRFFANQPTSRLAAE